MTRAHKTLPTQKELHEILNYDPETGEFQWIEWKSGREKSMRAGCLNRATNYVYIGLNGSNYYAHRLAWVWVYGVDPENKVIDHIDRDTTNNRIRNLRLAENGDNQKNAKTSSKNSSGHKGVYWLKERSRWSGQVNQGGKTYRTKDFVDKDECIAATRELRIRIHQEFARH